MKSLRSSKCLKTTVELTFTTQKANACSPWTGFFWVNLVQKLKIISLSWNFVPRLIQIGRIPWWCSPFPLSTGHIFLGKFGTKNQNWQFKLNLVQRLIWISRIQWGCSLFLFLTINIFLEQIWSKNSKLFVQSEIWYKD